MNMVAVLDYAAMDGVISMRDAIGLLEQALTHEARGSTSVSPKFVTEFKGGAMRVLFAADSDAGYCAIKAYHNINGAGARYVVLLYSLKDGALMAVLDGSLITDLRTGAVIQYAAAGAVMLPLAVSLETMQVDWTWQFVAAFAWLSVVLSLGAVSLLYWLIRHGAAAKVASLFYLVPPFAAMFAWLLFGETLGPVALGGMAIAAVGVAMVQRG